MTFNRPTIYKFLGEYLCSLDANIENAARELANARYGERPEGVPPPKFCDLPKDLRNQLHDAIKSTLYYI